MKKSTKIRIAVNAAVLVAAIVLSIAFDGILTGAHTQMWQRAIYIIGIIGTGVGALAGMFFGWKGYLCSYAGLTLLILPHLLPKPWNGIFVAVGYGALFIWTAVKKKRKTDVPETEEPEIELTEEEKQLEEKSRPLTLAVNPWNSKRYQLVCKNKELIAYYIGSDFKGSDESLLQTDEENLRQPDKMDIVIPLNTILSANVKGLPGPYREQVFLKTTGKNYRLNLMPTHENSSFADFWQDILPGKTSFRPLKTVTKADEPEENIVQPDPGRVKLFRTLKVCFGVYLGLVNLPWMFIDVPYRLFSILSLAALPVLLLAYILFPGELTMMEDKDCKGKVPIMSVMAFAAPLPALRSLLDFNITSIGRVVLLSGLLFAMLLGTMLLSTKEWRRRKSVIAMLILYLLFYAPGAIVQVNYDFDNSAPVVQQAKLVDKRISHTSKGPITYRFSLILTNGEDMRIRTGRENYVSHEVGDMVELYFFDGALDIPYVFVD